MQAGLGVFHQQQRAGVTVQPDGSFRLQQGGEQPQQDHPVRTAAGPVDHPVDDVEIAPAALLVVRSASHQPIADR
ncbi:hypothetical protein D3C79_1092390 [compost metagenome]